MSRYILQCILINKNQDKLIDAINWLLSKEDEIIIEAIEEDEKYYILIQNNLSSEYFPILFETVNANLGINYLYYSKYMFPKLEESQVKL